MPTSSAQTPSLNFIGLYPLVWTITLCSFKDEVDELPVGLPMDNPLSPLVAEVLMDSLEFDMFKDGQPLTGTPNHQMDPLC